MREKFLSCYYEVFQEDGEQKPCGREKCIKLIEAAEELEKEINPTAHSNFGSKDSGIMVIEKIKLLRSALYKYPPV